MIGGPKIDILFDVQPAPPNLHISRAEAANLTRILCQWKSKQITSKEFHLCQKNHLRQALSFRGYLWHATDGRTLKTRLHIAQWKVLISAIEPKPKSE